MKHKILSLAVCLLLSILPSWSQDNNNTPLSYRPTFNFYGIDSNGHPVCPSISPAGTKEINGHLFQTYVFGQEETERTFYIREEGNKIFRFFEDEQVEKIIIDFDSRVGDIFTKADGSQLTVTAVRDTTLWNNQHKMICLSEDGNTEADVWIENIGSVLTGFFLPDDLPGITLKRVIFSTTAIPGNSQCWLTTRMNMDNLKTDFTVEADEKTGDASKPLTYEFEDGNLIVKGAVTKTISNFHQYTCIIHDSDIYFSIDDGGALRHGTKNLSVDLRFMNITPGTYNIHYGTWMRGTEFEDLQAPQTVECKNSWSQEMSFIENGKTWHVLEFGLGGNQLHHPYVLDYQFVDEEYEINGNVYHKMIVLADDVENTAGWYREESGKVYRFDENTQSESIVYDFTLKEGDTFQFASSIDCTVSKVDFVELNGRQLRRITFAASRNGASGEYCWIEGIGSFGNPQGDIHPDEPNSKTSVLAYVHKDKSEFIPCSFAQNYNGWWGQQLVITEKAEMPSLSEGESALEYEFIGETLHVSGYMWTSGSPNQYIYCKTERTDDWQSYLVSFDIIDVDADTDEKSIHFVDCYFEDFEPNTVYFINDSEGKMQKLVSSIQQPDTPSVQTAPLFDLSGRRITGKPGPGVYIQGKRKVVIDN